MRRNEAIERLRQHQAEIAAHGVRALYLFGSTRRDEAKPESDVDLFVDYEEGFSLLDVAGIGNVLRHEYHRIEDRIVWSVIRNELPHLRAHLEAMRAEVESEP